MAPRPRFWAALLLAGALVGPTPAFAAESTGLAEETPADQKTVFDAPESDSGAIPAKEGISGRKTEPSARGTKK